MESDQPTSEESVPEEKRLLTSRLKSMATILAASGALATAVGSWFKPRDDSATKVSYEVLSKEIKALSEENALNHDEIVKERAYLEGYIKATEMNFKNLSGTSNAPASQRPRSGSMPMPMPGPRAGGTAPPSPEAAAAAMPLIPNAQAPAPPPVKERPKAIVSPSFDMVQRKADKSSTDFDQTEF